MADENLELETAKHLFRNGKFSEALTVTNEILRSNPLNVLAQELKAYILANQDQLDECISILEDIAGNKVYLPSAIFELSGIYINNKEFSKAEFHLRRLIDRGENFFELYFQLGFALLQQNKYSQSIEYFSKAKIIQPNFIPTYINLANIYGLLGSHSQSDQEFNSAIYIDPNNLDLLNQYSQYLFKQKLIPQAFEINERSLKINPLFIDGLLNKILILEKNSNYLEASEICEKVLKIDSKNEIALNKKINLFDVQKKYKKAIDFYNTLKSQDERDLLIAKIAEIKTKICDWEGFGELKQRVLQLINNEKCIYPFTLLNLFDSVELENKNTAQYIDQYLKRNPNYIFKNKKKNRNTRIRLGYISADFSLHPVAFLVAEVFELHDRSNFEVICISIGPNTNDPMRKRIEFAADQFYDFNDLEINNLCMKLNELELDIAIDLNGFTRDSKPEIFLNRVAPIQINFLGYPGTTTEKLSDFIIADKQLIPIEDKYTERVICLSNTYQPHDSKRFKPDKLSGKSELGIGKNNFVYCCFNNNFKINPDVMDAWAKILESTEDSILWLLEDSDIAKENLLREFRIRKIQSSRIVFAKRIGHDEHMTRLQDADLFLDTWPYNAHTTASDALWSGVPILTKVGNTFASRVCGSLLYAAKLQELITYSIQDYINCAVRYRKDSFLRESILKKMQYIHESALFNSCLYTQDLEKNYLRIIQNSRI